MRDRDAIKSQLLEVQMDYHEKATKLNDDPWKAISRQQKLLWLKFQQACSEFESNESNNNNNNNNQNMKSGEEGENGRVCEIDNAL